MVKRVEINKNGLEWRMRKPTRGTLKKERRGREQGKRGDGGDRGDGDGEGEGKGREEGQKGKEWEEEKRWERKKNEKRKAEREFFLYLSLSHTVE